MSSDTELLAAWSDGDEAAGTELFDRYYGPVARFFRTKAGAEAADLVQETFLRCVKGAERFRADGSFRSFLFAIAYNVLHDHCRRRMRDAKHFDPATVTAHDLGPGPRTNAARREQQRLIVRALQRIPLVYQVVLELHYWEGATVAEIAEIIAAPPGTIKTRLRKGRALLEVELVALDELTRDSAA